MQMNRFTTVVLAVTLIIVIVITVLATLWVRENLETIRNFVVAAGFAVLIIYLIWRDKR